MKTTFAKSPHRSPSYTKFATPLVLDSPRHCGLGTILLSWGKHLLGTSHDCSVRVRANGVESRHAMIVVSEHRTVVKALDPRTWVNEGPVSEMALRPGDRLSVGPLTFRVRAADSDELAAIAEANEHTFDDDCSSEVVAELAKTTLLAEFLGETRSSNDATPAAVTTAVPPVAHSISTEAAATPVELPQVVEVAAVTPPVATNDIAPQPTSVEPISPVEVAPTVKAARSTEASATSFTPTATLDLRLDEIEQNLAELQQPIGARSTSTDDAAVRTDALVSERRQLLLRQDELQQRADELARQSQQLHERVARVAEREADVERSQTRLALEHEQLSATAEVTRKELDDEYARHMTLWQEWDAAYRRTSGELNGQLQSMEQRRTALLTEADRLAGERFELQRLQADHERDRRVHAAERVQLTTDRAALQSLRAEFDTERQQHLVAVQEREAQVAAERRTMSITQEELLATRQQLERDRSEFLALRSTEALRRGQELREHVELRERLDQDHARIQTQQLEVNELRRAFAAERTAFVSQQTAFDSQQAAVVSDRAERTQLRDRLQQAETNLTRWQHTRQAAQAVSIAVVDNAATLPPTSLDWIFEPYKNIHTPPPIPVDGSNASSSDGNAAEKSVVTQLPADILPMPRAIPATFDRPTLAESSGEDSPQSVTEVAVSLTDLVRGDQELSDASPASRVTAPAAASHRFWEDHTLYDVSVSTHSQHPAPTRFVASSNLMMSASAAALAVSMPPDALALGDDGAQSPASNSSDQSPEDSSVTLWSRSLDTAIPDMATEMETFGSTATAIADVIPTVDETLAEINRQFGVPLSAPEFSPTADAVAAMPSWWSAPDATAVTRVEDHLNTDDSSIETRSAGGPDASSSVPIDSADPISSLRAELARLFDLPTRATAEHGETTDSTEALANDEDSHADHDYMELTLVPTAYDVSSEPSSEVEANNEPDTGSTSLSLHETTASSVSDSATDTAGESTDEAAPAIKAEDSIEACMAKLLSRTRGTEVSENDVKSLTAAAASAAVALRESDASNSESSARNAPFDPADRSHLKAEPKHKQDRQAARDDLQSFRQVAHQSARSALARHTSKALLSAMIAKAMLLGVSVLATTVFLGVPLMGMPTQIWNGAACSLATLLSAIEVYRSWRQLHCWKGAGELPRKNATIPVASPATASESAASEEKAVEIPAAAITKSVDETQP